MAACDHAPSWFCWPVLLRCPSDRRAQTHWPSLCPGPWRGSLSNRSRRSPDPSALPAPASEPLVLPQDPAPVVIDGGAEVDADDAEAPELTAEPPPERESAPQAEPDPVAAPEPVNTTLPPTDVPTQVSEPPALESPRSAATTDRGLHLLAKVDVLLRRVKERMRRVTSELDAGKTPADSSLRELRQDVEELAPALGAIQRRAAAHVSHELDTVAVERRLRWVLRRTAVLITALARSGVDTAESSRLLIVLERFATASATGPAPRRAGSSHPGRGAAAGGRPAACVYAHFRSPPSPGAES